jgi:hypothetical protein
LHVIRGVSDPRADEYNEFVYRPCFQQFLFCLILFDYNPQLMNVIGGGMYSKSDVTLYHDIMQSVVTEQEYIMIRQY